MNSKGHFYISIFKSLVRMLGCAITIFASTFVPMACFFIAAEILGVAEELVDKR